MDGVGRAAVERRDGVKSPRNDRRATALAPRTPGHVRLARAGPAVPGDAAGCRRQVDCCAANAEVDEGPLVADSSELAAGAGANTQHAPDKEAPGRRVAVLQ